MIHIYILIFLQIFPTKKKDSVSEWVIVLMSEYQNSTKRKFVSGYYNSTIIINMYLLLRNFTDKQINLI